jgi:hypothetical protein
MGKMSSKESDINDLLAVLQRDGSYIDRNNEITWYNDQEQMHREDGPAIIYPVDGWNAAGVEWWLNDIPHTFDEWCIALNITDEAKMLLKLQYG